jgi:hypothetical protein
MIPIYSRVAAIDDNEEHLQKIVWGLIKAGFCPVPFHFSDGRLEEPPSQPIDSIRIVFTDIHMVGGSMSQPALHANNIINCLKKIVSNCPYILIFWSQYPGDSEDIEAQIRERATSAGLTLPIGYAAIDKNEVFRAAAIVGTDDGFDAEKLRGRILEVIGGFKTLGVAMSWEDRVARAANKTTNRLFDLVRGAEHPESTWEMLLAYLSAEAVGQKSARENLTNAFDQALLPLLEDQLYLIGDEPSSTTSDAANLLRLISRGDLARPQSVPVSNLNASYLIEETVVDKQTNSWARGMVSQLGPSFVNSGSFLSAFGCDAATLIRQEFATRAIEDVEYYQLKLHMVELGPECDHVQGKMSTQRYLLGLLVPKSLIGAMTSQGGKKISSPKYRNESVMDIGRVALRNSPNTEWHLLISTRCFMTLGPKGVIDSVPRFRLRHALLEEVGHRYITHARRPGVMRFKD